MVNSGIANGTCKSTTPAPENFLDSDIFHCNSYYIWAEHTSPPKPVFFIRTEEVDALLNEINNAFEDCSLCLGVEAQEFGLVCSFPNHPDLRPRYLGHCCSREQYLSLERHISDSDFRPDGEPESIDPVDDSVMANFKLKLDMAIDVARGKSRAGKVVRQKQRTENRQKWKSELKDAERMLGLRPAHVAAPGWSSPFSSRSSSPGPPPILRVPPNRRRLRRPIVVFTDETPELDPDESWTEQKARYASLEESKSYVGASSPPRQSIQDDHGLPPYPFDGQPILVSLDIECHEYDKSKITEVGIGILDTNDIVGVAPRNNGKGWHKYIEAYHFRIKEYMHLCNVEYVAGCPDRFEFGHSIVCPASDAVDLITTLFQSCYAGDIPESCDLDTHDAPLHPTSPRRIILIGHDVTQDIRYLTRLGLPLKSIPTKEVIDTADLYKALHREWNHKGLSTLMHDYGFVAWNMHNAGNDAVYTLWVCFALTLRGAQDCGSEVVRNAFQSKKMKAMQEAIDSAYEKVLEDHEGWSDEEDAVVGMDGTSGDVSRRSSGSKKPKVVWESDKE